MILARVPADLAGATLILTRTRDALLKENSFNEIGDKQIMITNRIKEISKLLPGKLMDKKMNKIEGKE